MKKKSVILAVLAVILVLTANLPLAWGYFSTYTEARGGIRMQSLEIDTDIKEEVSDWTKHVAILNRGDVPVYVRARAFAGSEYNLVYDTGGNWTLGDDGFFYYNNVLNPGETTPELLVKIENPPKDPTEGQEFNVVVVYECIPVQFDASGEQYADWNMKLTARERSAE